MKNSNKDLRCQILKIYQLTDFPAVGMNRLKKEEIITQIKEGSILNILSLWK